MIMIVIIISSSIFMSSSSRSSSSSDIIIIIIIIIIILIITHIMSAQLQVHICGSRNHKLRPVCLLRVWVSEGLTQADS